MYAGAPQGSILGPLLRNLVFSGLLKEFKAIPKMNAVVFADDLAVILDVSKHKEANNKLSTALGVIVRWWADKGLKIAQEKIEVILLTGKRIPR